MAANSTSNALVPIEQHALLSDQRTAALVDANGRITWLCAPRLDDAAVFAEILDTPAAGYFSVSATDGVPATSQRYVGNTMIVETSWPDFTVTDYLDISEEIAATPAGRSDLIRHLHGSGAATIEFAPRLDFGRAATSLVALESGLRVQGADFEAALHSLGVTWEITSHGDHQTATADVDLSHGAVTLELRLGTSGVEPGEAEQTRRDRTARFWSDWVDALDLPSVETDFVRRSALTLKALVYGPTGAIAAAATTSLPEHIGGERNWDYRYCWLRDGAMTAAALVRLGSNAEGLAFLDWTADVLDRAGGQTENLKPLYTLDGGSLAPETEIAALRGYGGSQPVRTGNAADAQIQLDVFGPVVDLAQLLVDHGAQLSDRQWALVEAMVEAVSVRWTEADQGIWEVRSAPRHHVYSKVMCWLTVDRAMSIGESRGSINPGWLALRDEIAADVLAHGWSDEVDSFTTAYEGTDLDASVLMIGLSGLLDAQNPQFASTVRAVADQLQIGPTVYRYHHEDGLTGTEGGFHLMTSWMVDSLALLGKVDEATSLLRGIIATAGPTGLLTEEFDPETQTALGNFPQAYSHLGVINNAIRLS